ncbi:hypothetical protein MNBD_GAMMA09-2181 [hydrothermal vent metagenome]|uniref:TETRATRICOPEPTIDE REPEAT FAMILY PROTEIN n=1 Tax=hydrothermal vent metagenome TaxID=652676 RepID=A0A3B0XPT5_9ZZZZ
MNRWISLLALALLINHTNIQAKPYDPSASVFRFHKKMAERNVAESQLKLGLMYETGSGTKQNLVSARSWYKKAATQNYKPAINRLTYLQIKQSGFTKQNEQWLKNLKKDARFNAGEALFLLGQMYSEGTGVNKSLTKSLEFLRKAAAGNIPGSEAEIIRVENELTDLQEKYQLKNNAVAIATSATAASPVPPPAKLASTKTKTRRVPSTPEKTHVKNSKKPESRPKSTKSAASLTAQTKKTSTLAMKTSQIKTTAASPVIKQVPVSIEQPHPMDVICGGLNRFRRNCR